MTPLTVSQIAERYSVSESTVLEWIRTGELCAISVSRNPRSKRPHWRITAAALEQFEATRTASGPPAPRARRAKQPRDVIEFYRT